jgi:hypothetical protein
MLQSVSRRNTEAVCANLCLHRVRGNMGGSSPQEVLGIFKMVGPNGLEPSTSSVSGRRSNQLSYGPIRALRLLLPTVPAIQETTHHATVSRQRSIQLSYAPIS